MVRLSSRNGEDSCYAMSVLLPGMITLSAVMCCCGSVGEMETQSMYPRTEPASCAACKRKCSFALLRVCFQMPKGHHMHSTKGG